MSSILSAEALATQRASRDALPPKLRAAVPDPDVERLHALASQMARPISRGWLRGAHAYAALAIQAADLQHGDAALAAAWQTLVAWVAWHRQHRHDVARRIAATVQPMIAAHERRGMILAEAHGLNGGAGFPFSEPEVNDLVETEVWYALPSPPNRGRRYVR